MSNKLIDGIKLRAHSYSYIRVILRCTLLAILLMLVLNVEVLLTLFKVEHAKQLAHELAEAQETAIQNQEVALAEQKSALNSAWMADKESALGDLRASHDEAMEQV